MTDTMKITTTDGNVHRVRKSRFDGEWAAIVKPHQSSFQARLEFVACEFPRTIILGSGSKEDVALIREVVLEALGAPLDHINIPELYDARLRLVLSLPPRRAE